MDYFKKVGRPTDEEQAVINVIEKTIIEKQILRTEIPNCETLDDLLEVLNLLEAYVSKKEDLTPMTEERAEVVESDIIENSSETDFDNQDKENLQDSVSQQIEDKEKVLVEQEKTPSNVIVETEPTTENVETVSIDTERVEIEQEQENNEPINLGQPHFISSDYDPFSDEIKERSYNINTEPKTKVNTLNKGDDQNNEPLNLEESKQTPVDNLNPKTKRKVAEQTANSILKGYAKLAPQPFKWLAKIDEQKIEKLALNGEININIEVSEGMTFDDYMKQTNEQVDEIFAVDEDTLDEIREPLIEVLMEQELELTPQQRLLMAVVSHLFQMFTIAFSLRKQNNRILEYQKKLSAMGANKKAA